MGKKALAGLVITVCLFCAVGVGEDARHVDLSARWERSGKNVLGGFVNMYHATVLQTDDASYPFKMWFFGWAAADCNPGFDGCDAIFFARGKDLDHWEVYCGDGSWDSTQTPKKWKPVVTARDKFYDGWHNGDPSVVLHNGRYYMAYSATGPNKDGILAGHKGDTDADILCVMGAVSRDGIHWDRTEAPLLIYEPEIGAPHDKNGAFMFGMYHRPSLLLDNGKWRLWFDYWTHSGVSMGYAEADKDAFAKPGGFRVIRAGDNPVLPEWPNPSVVKVGNKYRCFADPSGYGAGWPGRQLAEAESDDGINWKILGWIPPDKDTPACQVPSATIIRDKEGKKWLVVFYACQIGGEPYNWRYDRIRYMRQAIEK